MERPRSTEEERQAVLALLGKGLSYGGAARVLGRSATWASRVARQAGVKSTWRPEPRPWVDRFWSWVDRRGPDECWEWRGTRHVRGYGHFSRDGRKFRAHRVAWELERGPIPEGMVVSHWCDNPPCVNPAHLMLTTQRINTIDAVNKGRISPRPATPWHPPPDRLSPETTSA